MRRPDAHLNAAELANFVAARAVAHATAFLDGRTDMAELARNGCSVQLELLALPGDGEERAILDAARLLVIAMMGSARCGDEPRRARWRQVMGALVELVLHESLALRGEILADGAVRQAEGTLR